MALTTTTASVAIAATDQTITVASATSFSAGLIVRVNAEFMTVRKDYVSGTVIPVLRGQAGTFPAAHGITSNVTFGNAGDFAVGAPQGPLEYPYTRVRQTKAYGAAGAITLPTPGNDMLAIINGTSALAMTLANPTKDQDGDMLIIVGNGKSASTVTYTAGLGNGGSAYDVVTFQNAGQVSLSLIACNGIWVSLNTPFTGTSTALSVAIA